MPMPRTPAKKSEDSIDTILQTTTVNMTAAVNCDCYYYNRCELTWHKNENKTAHPTAANYTTARYHDSKESALHLLHVINNKMKGKGAGSATRITP